MPHVATYAGGAIPPIQIYPSGAVYHTSCAVQRIITLTSHQPFLSHLKNLLDTLARHKGNDTASAAAADVLTAQHQLAAALRGEYGDPLNSERVLTLLELPYGEAVGEIAAWQLPRVSITM